MFGTVQADGFTANPTVSVEGQRSWTAVMDVAGKLLTFPATTTPSEPELSGMLTLLL